MARRRGVLATFAQLQREAERDRQRKARMAAAAAREVERANAARSRAQVQDQKVRDRLYAEERARQATEETELIERQVESLETVLAASLDKDDYLDLEALKQPPSAPVFDPASAGPVPPPPPRLESFLPAAPSGLNRVLGGAKHAEQTQQGRVNYEQAVQAHEAASREYAGRLDAARRQHAAESAHLYEGHRRHVEDVTCLQRDLAAGKPEAVVHYLDLVLESAQYPEGFPHRWKLAYTPTSRHLDIEYELPPPDVVPAAKAYKHVKATDTITATPRPAAQVRSIYVSLIVQTALRVIHEIVEADRSSMVRTVVFNAHGSGVDMATGRTIRPCLVALATSRERFLQLNLARVDPTACLAHLEARVSKDPSKLVGVEPIALRGTLDSGYAIDTDDEEAGTASSEGVEESPPVSSRPSSANRQDLVAGQNVALAGTRVQVELPTRGADLSVLLLGGSGQVDQDEDFVFYNNPVGAGGAVELRGGDSPDGALVDLSRLADRYERLVLVASANDNVGSVAGAALVVRTGDGDGEISFRATNQPDITAQVCGELYRRNGEWRLRAVGQGWADGLAGLARDYGVDVS